MSGTVSSELAGKDDCKENRDWTWHVAPAPHLQEGLQERMLRRILHRQVTLEPDKPEKQLLWLYYLLRCPFKSVSKGNPNMIQKQFI